ncbi:helix-turn-helix transcriptional regulator [Clostridium sp. AM58-1XD]|uniref:helix-turn-helix domain-containing protein n=1 Tax=Clostridium sp. AM58-1XD TaxID=2292307 RepID=UPI000E4E1F9C|nr:helix-turn-helix transcriptional regulator [Clostridium sp. AM58-1XD]RGZ00611.1 XRE family transcriptional regulator [Clostridium sp. AM58-1XD]
MKILLKEIRRKKRLTIREVELLTGISRSAVNRIENEMVSPSMDEMEMLAEGLHMGIVDLFDSDVKYANEEND